MFRNILDIYRLRTQLILSFIFLVLITVLATGVPALVLINSQQNRQAWAQVDQGTRTSQTLFEAKQSELEDLATLTAQRPTLLELLALGSQLDLISYLTDLQKSAGFDLVSVCKFNDEVASYPEGLFSDNICLLAEPNGYHFIESDKGGQAWLLASHPISVDQIQSQNVIVGLSLDYSYTEQMLAQTGLDHTFYYEAEPVASSLSIDPKSLSPISIKDINSDSYNGGLKNEFRFKDQPYFANRFLLSKIGLEAEVALAVGAIQATRLNLLGILVASMIIAIIIASVLGAFLARQISQPLVGLADSAARLSSGDLNKSAVVETQVREVLQVSKALEDARHDLQRTLNSLRKEIEWGDHLLDSIVEGIVTLDDQNRITFFSSGAERITGWYRDEILNRNVDDVFTFTELNTPFSQHIPSPDQKKILTLELTKEQNVTLAITGANLLPSKSGAARVALVFRDVSEEQAMHHLLGHFMENITHEFRTPLSSLAASIELLLDQAPELSRTEMEELLTSLYLGTVRLQTLVDNLLESASIESGRFRVSPRPSDLGNIIGEAVQTMEPLLNKYGQRLVVELPIAIPLVYADPRRTVQVLVNLLSNANKFGPTNEEITVTAEAIEGWISMAVSDRGPGIPQEYREGLFTRFVRPGHLNADARAGAGLGLSVVKAIIEAQGGMVGVKDYPAGGALFWFTLKLVDEE